MGKRVILAAAVATASLAVLGACNAVLGIGDPIVVGLDAQPDADPMTPQRDSRPPEEDSAPPDDDCVRTKPDGLCGLVPQCGCTDSQTCDITDFVKGKTTCVPSGNRGPGIACTSTTQCNRGLTCGFGTCRSYCKQAGSQCASGECIQTESTGGQALPNALVCLFDCAPHDPSSCGAGSTCAAFDKNAAGTEGLTDCRKEGTRLVNEPCTTITDCRSGLACAGNMTCQKWCRVGNSDCVTGTCSGFSTPFRIKGVEYGFCI